ncbi:MAG: hypothetical protein COB50_01720 [Thiotrichales bacterium]|nr:MAG: hypothetical protein COB50_01720 [Thiotrichales bacterium]
MKIENLNDDYYVFSESSQSLTGDRKRKVYKLGDKLNVKLTRVDVANRRIDFLLA